MVWMKTYRDENGAGDLTQWQHDLATGLVTNKVYADGKGTAYAYTADGKLSRRTWARGIATDYGYTAAGELETVDYSDATPDVSYTHDRLGRPVTITDVLGTRTNVYDVATLALAQEKLPDGLTLTRSQDVLGRPAGISVAGGGDPGQLYAVEYGYDAYGRFGSVTSSVSSVSSVVNYSYLPGSDLLTGYSTPGGMSFQRTFEPNRDLIASVTNAWNGAAVSRFAYTNDELGRRAARVDSGLTQNSFGYNIRSEVIEAIMGSNTYGYEYDPIGNRLASTNNATTVSYAANLLNQYTNVASAVSITPTYDDDGNMTEYGDWGFEWNGENRLIAATNATEAVSYTYDHQGRMVEKTTDSATTRYLWDDFNIIAELGASETRYNIWGLDLSQTPQGAGGVGGLLAVAVAGGADPGIFYPAYDANGNITEYVDATGDVVATRAYSPFGETTAATGNADAFSHWWSTKPWDPVTGFSEYEFRMYNPELGRWVNRDPIGEDGGLSVYGFVANDPLLHIDSLGLFFEGVPPEKPFRLFIGLGDPRGGGAPPVHELQYNNFLNALSVELGIDRGRARGEGQRCCQIEVVGNVTAVRLRQEADKSDAIYVMAHGIPITRGKQVIRAQLQLRANEYGNLKEIFGNIKSKKAKSVSVVSCYNAIIAVDIHNEAKETAQTDYVYMQNSKYTVYYTSYDSVGGMKIHIRPIAMKAPLISGNIIEERRFNIVPRMKRECRDIELVNF